MTILNYRSTLFYYMKMFKAPLFLILKISFFLHESIKKCPCNVRMKVYLIKAYFLLYLMINHNNVFVHKTMKLAWTNPMFVYLFHNEIFFDCITYFCCTCKRRCCFIICFKFMWLENVGWNVAAKQLLMRLM